jgi:prepilin-type N-terminal cleavage/methylation domain-containing protein
MNRRGYSIVELLIVLAVLGVILFGTSCAVKRSVGSQNQDVIAFVLGQYPQANPNNLRIVYTGRWRDDPKTFIVERRESSRVCRLSLECERSWRQTTCKEVKRNNLSWVCEGR